MNITENALNELFAEPSLGITPDIPRLRKVVEWVEVEATKPDPHDREWYQPNYFVQSPVFNCGTVCCVAGKIALEDGWTPSGAVGGGHCERDGELRHAHEVAKEALGLTDRQAFALFRGINTAEQVRQAAEQIAGERL